VIIWINGAFGAGKSALSEQLVPRLPGSLVFDPEEIGYALGRLVPASPTGDFQDLPIWRSMTLHALREVHRLYGGTIIVPMTLVQPGYVEEIIGGLLATEKPVLHVFLDVDAETLRSRIAAQVTHPDPAVDQRARAWRLAQVDRCVAARDTMPAGTVIFDSGAIRPEGLADEVVALTERQ
jgi:AAA domain